MSEAPIPDQLDCLLGILPQALQAHLEGHPEREALVEVVMDLGRRPEARFPKRSEDLSETPVGHADLDQVVGRIGAFGGDNRAGIEATLHRISAIRNRQGRVVGLTLRVGRAVLGTIDVVRDLAESGRSLLIMGRPGVGKTTKLRELARVIADELGKRVVVIDTSNEIAGDGDIPHPAIGRARRMQVSTPEAQEKVMIEAVENHMPEVIVIDEISTEKEAWAARTIAERGVQLIATAHGNSLENLLMNPTLSDLVGGIQSVTLSDEEARRRGTQKTILERKGPPTFDVAIELQDRDRLAVHHDVAEVVDQLLRGHPPQPEIRGLGEDGQVVTLRQPSYAPAPPKRQEGPKAEPGGGRLRLFPYAVSRSQLERVIRSLRLPATVARNVEEADVLLVLRPYARGGGQVLQQAEAKGVPIYVVKANTIPQITKSLREVLHLDGPPGAGALTGPLSLEEGGPPEAELDDEAQEALTEARVAVAQVLSRNEPTELNPRSPKLRRLQHQLVEASRLRSESYGEEPNRRLRIFPRP